MKPLVVILGPTASGKTELSLLFAKKLNGEIISADSRQIYKDMKIGTNLIQKKDRKGIPHHLLEITTIDKQLSLAEYHDLAIKKITQIHKKGKIPILVGGTGLYISSIIEGYDIPRVAPNTKLRKKLYAEAKSKGAEFLHKKLKKLDPQAAAAIHPNNVRYVVRAIEVSLAKKEGGNTSRGKGEKFNAILYRIKIPRAKLYERIDKRVDMQIKSGLVNEVKKLFRKYKENFPAMSSLGVKEITPYLKGKMTLDECAEVLKRNTRRYAKRQMTWFRRYDKVNWLTEKNIKKIQWQKIRKKLSKT